MRRPPAVLIPLLVTVLAGCEAASRGVVREGRVPRMPSRALVESAIRGTPGVDSVRDWNRDSLRPRDSTVSIYFSYWGRGGAYANVQFGLDSSDGRVFYMHDHTDSGTGNPSQAAVDATVPLMHAVEARLASIPGLEGLRRGVVQKCYDVRCP